MAMVDERGRDKPPSGQSLPNAHTRASPRAERDASED